MGPDSNMYPVPSPKIHSPSVNTMEYKAFIWFRYQSLCCWKNSML